jgi:hypothetical protein
MKHFYNRQQVAIIVKIAKLCGIDPDDVAMVWVESGYAKVWHDKYTRD